MYLSNTKSPRSAPTLPKSAAEKSAAWRAANPEKVRAWRTANAGRLDEARRLRTRLISLYKQLSGCSECGFIGDPRQFDLHHTDPTTKAGKGANVSNMVARGWKGVEAEIRKCVVLCANCHRVVE